MDPSDEQPTMPVNAPRISRRRPAAAPQPPSSDSDSLADQETISQPDSEPELLLGQQQQLQQFQSRAIRHTGHLPTTSDFEEEEEDEAEEADDDDGEEEADVEEEEVEDASFSTDANNKPPSPTLAGLKEIGNLASWTVSTAKPGNGIEQLRDEDTSLFWQSDGPQPHHINIHFAKRVKVKRIRMYLDFENDESYTPTKMSVLSGTGHQDLVEVTKLELERPTGWVEVKLDDVHEDGELRTFLIQIAIHANHQNGKDTHVRGLQIYASEPAAFDVGGILFNNSNMLSELELR
ncbi:APC10-domain-containing protein [Wilcoxina mikolae CBS 423.85]|nr:APC10-domain-containing protein [Wilcoxina mikolae CBS 423.85]